MDLLQAKRILEGLLFISDQPLTFKRLKGVLDAVDPQSLRRLIEELNAEYEALHAFRIQEVAGGYQLVTDPQLAPVLKRALEAPAQDTLRKPAMETLAIIAYRQPITKAEIELIRGVDGGATLDTLLERQFIKVVGRKETPGRPLLYGTTDEFLRHLGLNTLKDLPVVTDVTNLPLLPGSGDAAPSAAQEAELAEALSAESAASEATGTESPEGATVEPAPEAEPAEHAVASTEPEVLTAEDPNTTANQQEPSEEHADESHAEEPVSRDARAVAQAH